MIQNKTKALFLGLGLLAGTATTFGIAAYAQTSTTVASVPIVESVTAKADTDNIQDIGGDEVQDTNVRGTNSEIDDDKGGIKDVNEQKESNEKSETEVQGSQEVND